LQSLEANFQASYTKNQIFAYTEENRQALADRSDLDSCKLVINRFVEKVIITPEDVHIKYRFGVDVDNHGSPNGIRTRVSAVRGRCPRPLDDKTIIRCERWDYQYLNPEWKLTKKPDLFLLSTSRFPLQIWLGEKESNPRIQGQNLLSYR
jgi:hypothetical protein